MVPIWASSRRVQGPIQCIEMYQGYLIDLAHSSTPSEVLGVFLILWKVENANRYPLTAAQKMKNTHSYIYILIERYHIVHRRTRVSQTPIHTRLFYLTFLSLLFPFFFSFFFALGCDYIFLFCVCSLLYIFQTSVFLFCMQPHHRRFPFWAVSSPVYRLVYVYFYFTFPLSTKACLVHDRGLNFRGEPVQM